MANLKDLKTRISSVKSTQKITKAMQMVAASKLRRAQENAEKSRPYTEKMTRMLTELAANTNLDTAPDLLRGHRTESGKLKMDNILIVVATADKGLCGGFNSSIVKETRLIIKNYQQQGKNVKILTVGKKGAEQIATTHRHLIIDKVDTSEQKSPTFSTAEDISERIISLFEKEKIDGCHIVFNKFVSPLEQIVTQQQLIPLTLEKDDATGDVKETTSGALVHEYEPDETTLLSYLLPHNIAVQIFSAQLENSASEQGARMTAMDNATRNAGDMINDLTLIFNRTRQAAITTELTEIISGAEAL